MKPDYVKIIDSIISPAAFGRLCVETWVVKKKDMDAGQPPSGGCVLKQD